MSTLSKAALLLVLFGVTAALAAGMSVSVTPQIGGGIGGFDGGISYNATPVVPPTACTVTGLDYSDATGCNLTLYMVGLR